MNSLRENNAREWVESPPGSKAIGCKWGFKSKYNIQGSFEKFKAKCFCQIFRKDFDETFVSIASQTTIRNFLSMAFYKNLDLRHVNIKTVFLHNYRKMCICVNLKFVILRKTEIYRLLKAMWGLKQAASAWNLKLHKSLLKFGFHQIPIDKCSYKLATDITTKYVTVYVDNLLIAGEDKTLIIL